MYEITIGDKCHYCNFGIRKCHYSNFLVKIWLKFAEIHGENQCQWKILSLTELVVYAQNSRSLLLAGVGRFVSSYYIYLIEFWFAQRLLTTSQNKRQNLQCNYVNNTSNVFKGSFILSNSVHLATI